MVLVNSYCNHQYVLGPLCEVWSLRRRVCVDADNFDVEDDNPVRRIDAQSLTLTLATLRTLFITPSPRAQSKYPLKSRPLLLIARHQLHWWD
jgi:hypothetical protein